MLAHGTSVSKMGLPIPQHSHSPLPSNDYPIAQRLDLSLRSLRQPDSIRGQRREGRRPLTSLPSHPSVSPLKTKDPLSVPLAHLGPTSPSLGPPYPVPLSRVTYGEQRKGLGPRALPGSAPATSQYTPTWGHGGVTPGTALLLAPTWGLPGILPSDTTFPSLPLSRDRNQPPKPPHHMCIFSLDEAMCL